MRLLREIEIYPELLLFVNCPASELKQQHFALATHYEIPHRLHLIDKEATIFIIAKLGLPEHFQYLISQTIVPDNAFYCNILLSLAREPALNPGSIQIAEHILTIVHDDIFNSNNVLLETAIAANNLQMADILLRLPGIENALIFPDIRIIDEHFTHRNLIGEALYHEFPIFEHMMQINTIRTLVINDPVPYFCAALSEYNIEAAHLMLSIPDITGRLHEENNLVLQYACEIPEITEKLLDLPNVALGEFPVDLARDEYNNAIRTLIQHPNGYNLVIKTNAYTRILKEYEQYKMKELRIMPIKNRTAVELDSLFNILIKSISNIGLNARTTRLLDFFSQRIALHQTPEGYNLLLYTALKHGNLVIGKKLLENEQILDNALTHNFFKTELQDEFTPGFNNFVERNEQIMEILDANQTVPHYYQLDSAILKNLLAELQNAPTDDPIRKLPGYHQKLIWLIEALDNIVNGNLNFLELTRTTIQPRFFQKIVYRHIMPLLIRFYEFDVLSPVEQKINTTLIALYSHYTDNTMQFNCAMARLKNPRKTFSVEEFTQLVHSANGEIIINYHDIITITQEALASFGSFSNAETRLLCALPNEMLNTSDYNPQIIAKLFFQSTSFLTALKKRYPDAVKIRVLEHILLDIHADSPENGALIFDLTTITPALDNPLPEAYHHLTTSIPFISNHLFPGLHNIRVPEHGTFNSWILEQQTFIIENLRKLTQANQYLNAVQNELDEHVLTTALIYINRLTALREIHEEHYFAEIKRLITAALHLVSGSFASVIGKTAALFTHRNCRMIAQQLIIHAFTSDNQLAALIIDTIVNQIENYKTELTIPALTGKRIFSVFVAADDNNDQNALNALINSIRNPQCAPDTSIVLQELIAHWRNEYRVSAPVNKFINSLVEQYADTGIIPIAAHMVLTV